MYQINWSDGRRELVGTLDAAAESVRERAGGDAVYCDNGDAVNEPVERELDNAGRILVWASEQDADGPDGMGDAGQNAVAEIVRA